MSNDRKDPEWPLVSIVTLVYNTGPYVLQALECVVRQNYPHIQHVIIDDCSTDDSARVVGDWINRNNYNCRFIKHQKNRGVQKTLEEAFGLIDGKYYASVSDDLWPDNKLIDQVRLLEELGDSYCMVYGDSDLIDKDGNVMKASLYAECRDPSFVPPSGDIFREVIKGFFFFIQAALIRLDYFREMNYTFDKEIISEDWDWQLWFSRNYKILGAKEIYAHYRWLDTSIGRTTWTDEKKHTVLLSHIKMLLKYYHDPKNNGADRAALFQRIWRSYMELSPLERFSREEKRRTLWTIFRVTREIRILPILGSIILFSKESLARKAVRLG